MIVRSMGSLKVKNIWQKKKITYWSWWSSWCWRWLCSCWWCSRCWCWRCWCWIPTRTPSLPTDALFTSFINWVTILEKEASRSQRAKSEPTATKSRFAKLVTLFCIVGYFKMIHNSFTFTRNLWYYKWQSLSRQLFFFVAHLRLLNAKSNTKFKTFDVPTSKNTLELRRSNRSIWSKTVW